MKTTDIKQAYKLILNSIKKHKGNFTLSDAAASTGLAIDEAKEALDKIMEKFTCKLQVTENGELIYNFGSLKERGSKTFSDILGEIGLFLWKAFTIFFKVWIAITLVVYFVLFLIVLLVLILGLSRGKSSKNIKFNWIGRIFISIFYWKTYEDTISYSTDRYGYRYKKFQSKQSIINPDNQDKKNFISSVYDFVFGPPRVKIDPLNNEKEVAAYLREKKGILTVSELVALAGWTFDEAEEFMSDCIVRFNGDAEISENMVMYGFFDRLIRSKSEFSGGKIEYYWNEYEPPYKITGNSTGKNALIIFMNTFNIIMGIVVLSTTFLHEMLMPFGIPAILVTIVMGYIPVIFSILFFLVPLLRVPYVLAKEKQRKYLNKRKRLFRIVFASLPDDVKFNKTINEINRDKLEPMTEQEVKKLLDKIRVELRGEKDADLQGEIVYSFNRIRDDYSEAEHLRQTMKIDTNPGKVVFEM